MDIATSIDAQTRTSALNEALLHKLGRKKLRWGSFRIIGEATPEDTTFEDLPTHF